MDAENRKSAVPEQMELRAPPQRGGPMTDFDWRLAENAWNIRYFKATGGNSLKNSRIALQLSTNEMAKRLGIRRNSYCDFEKRELTGRVTLENMKRIAAAMDCDFVYSLVPKSKRKFGAEVFEKLLEEAWSILEKRRPISHMKGLALASIAKDLLKNGKFRKRKGWSERKSLEPPTLASEDVHDSHPNHHDRDCGQK